MVASTDKPASLPATTTALTTAQQSSLTAALLSASAIPRIQQTLAHALHEEGWSANLRAYVLQLLRSGECSTYDEVMRRVLDETTQGLEERKNGDKNGKENGVHAGESLRVPDRAIKEGLRAVRKELDSVCDVTFD